MGSEKRVMKEDKVSNDFDWVGDVPNTLPKNDKWMLINDVDPDSLEVSKDIQNYLFSKGLAWNTGRKTPLYQRILAIHYVLPNQQPNGSFTYTPNGTSFQKRKLEVEYDREDLISRGKNVYYWSDLKPEKESVKESDNTIVEEPNFKTSDDELRNIAKKYETKKEWKHNDENTYQQALRRGKDFYDDITSHMLPAKKGRDVKILTNDELRNIAKKYETKKEWKKKSQSTWKRAKNRDKEIPGFYADITSHMNILRTSLSDDELRDIAKKYETRTEWYRKSPNTYRQAIRRDKEIPGFYADITSDMKRLEVSEKYIYAYEFYDGEEPIAAYIGLTCDMRRRSKEHETGFCRYGKSESTVTKYIKNNPKLKYKIVELESEPLEGKEAKAKERYWEELYRKKGWETLNVAKTGALGVTYIATNDELRNIAKKYETKNEWKTSVDGNAYRSALRRGKDFYDDITSHMVSGRSRRSDGKFKTKKQFSESNDLDWIEDAYEAEWTFDRIAQLYYSGDVDYVKIVRFKDLKHINGVLEWCAGVGDFQNNFKVGSVHQILSTNLDSDGQIYKNVPMADLDCGWCLDDPDSIGYDCNKKTKTMSLRISPKDPDYFVFSGDWVELEPIMKSDELNESSEGLEWIRDVEVDDSVRFDKDKLYYFNPPLNHDEIINLMNRIPNEIEYDPIKNWFESVFGGRAPQRYMTYFNVDGGDRNDGKFYVSGWCSETRWSQVNDEYYPHSEPVNGRDEFFGHYKIFEEKVDDFDWVRDTTSNPFYGTDIKLYIDKAPTLEQSELIWELMVDAGVTTMEKVRRHNRVHKLMNNEGTFIFIDHDGDFLHNVRDLSGYIENGRISVGNIIKFSDIFSDDEPSNPNDLSVSIKESNDFGWIGDIPLTLNHIFNQLEVGDELTLKGNTYGTYAPESSKFKYTEPFKITIQSIGPRLEDSDFKISVREKEAIVNLGIKHKSELLKKYPNSHVFKNNSFFEEDGNLEVISWVKSKDRIEESKGDFDWTEGFTAEFVEGVCLLRKDGTRWLVVDPPEHVSKGTTLVWLQRTHTQGVDITKKKRPISPFRLSALTRQLQSGLLTICN
jgi:cytochrome c553/predicted GIY-YIG superfamily endonuclease